MDPVQIDHLKASFADAAKEEVKEAAKEEVKEPVFFPTFHSVGVRAELRRLLFHSAVFAVIIPYLFSLSGGDPVLAGWTLSLFAIIYLFCFAVSYSTPATPLGKMLLSLSYLVLVAFCVGSLVSSVLGMVFIYAESILAAGFFGSVVAQHKEDEFREMTAIDAVRRAPAGKYQRQQGIYVILVILAMFYAVCWVVRPEGDYSAINVAMSPLRHCMSLFGAMAVLMFIHTTCVLGWLNGAVFGADSSPPVVALYSTIAILFLASYLVAGEIVALAVLWLCLLAAASFLGYYLRVHASYEELMMLRDEMQANNTTASSAATTQSSSPAPKDKLE